MKAKGLTQLKRCPDTSKLLMSSRGSALKDKYQIPAFTPMNSRTSKNVPGLHFEFPDKERNSSVTRPGSNHRRVSSTEVTRVEGEQTAQLLRIYGLIRTAYPSIPEVQDVGSERQVLEHIEAGVVLTVTQLKAKELDIERLTAQAETLSNSRSNAQAQLFHSLEKEKRLLAGQEEELKQARLDLDQAKEQFDMSCREQLEAVKRKEEIVTAREREAQNAAVQLEKERVVFTTACAKMRKRVKEAETQVKKLQTLQNQGGRTAEVQSKLKSIVKQESLLNAVAEDLQYQRSSLLAKLETTLTEISPQTEPDPSKSEDDSEPIEKSGLEGTDFSLRECSNLMSTREIRGRTKGSSMETTGLYRTMSRERPVDITEIYSEIEELGQGERQNPLDLTPKDVLTPKSLRSSRSLYES